MEALRCLETRSDVKSYLALHSTGIIENVLLRLQTKLRIGNVFTHVCLSTPSSRFGSAPRQKACTPPARGHAPRPDTVNHWTVCILLESILVCNEVHSKSVFVPFKNHLENLDVEQFLVN